MGCVCPGSRIPGVLIDRINGVIETRLIVSLPVWVSSLIKKKCLQQIMVWLLFLSMVDSFAGAGETGTGGLSGTILTSDGKALAGGQVLFFDASAGVSPFVREYWMLPDYVFPSTSDGSFTAQLPAGSYYILAVKKQKDHASSLPPNVGDYISPPVGVLRESYAVRSGVNTDIGASADAVPLKDQWLTRGKTGVEGVVRDADGRPVPGVLVIASASSSMIRPLFVSEARTDAGGNYHVGLPLGGQYYLKVRGPSDIVKGANIATGKVTTGIDIQPETLAGGILAPKSPSRRSSEVSCQTEDYSTAVSGMYGCLVIKKYGAVDGPVPQGMLVWLHGDLAGGGPADYLFPLAEEAAADFSPDNILSIALVRPGYPDGSGKYSAGNIYTRHDTYTKENIAAVGTAIERLRLKYRPKRLIIVGDGGGAAVAAVLLGMKPGLADGAVLVSCPCDLVRWRMGKSSWPHSENPTSWVSKISPNTKVVVLTGADDSDTLPIMALRYVDVLKSKGVNAVFQMLDDENHASAIRSDAVRQAIGRLLHDDGETGTADAKVRKPAE